MMVMTRSGALRHSANQWDSTTALLTTNPVPAGREEVWAKALTFLDAGQRDCAHLVASVLVIDDGGLVLLARHHRYRRWGPLGGHLDPGDSSLVAAAAREVREEAALTVHVHPAPINVLLASYRCRTAVEEVLHLDVCFAAFIAAPSPAPIANDELMGLEWFDPSSLPAPLTPPTAELVGLATAAAALRP
jgi:8-oxo-dGTP pyrophosphatase MutT (NUDIX family)